MGLEDRAERELATVRRIGPLPEIKFVSAGELLRTPKPTDWLIRKILQSDSMNTIIGAPGSFKSNLAIDMAASVATGIDWHGRPTKQGAVFIIAGEGHNGLAKRLKAWSIVRGVDLESAPLFVSMGAVGLVEPLTAAAVSEEVERLAAQTKQHPVLVIVDTLARNFGPGDENSASDMSRFILNLDVHIRQRFKCSVTIVHHTGVMDSTRARGSSALFAAVDAEMICQRDGQERTLTLKCRKQKDGPEFEPILFEARIVELPWPGDDKLPKRPSPFLRQVRTLLSERRAPRSSDATSARRTTNCSRCTKNTGND
jgi:hypothetical protein